MNREKFEALPKSVQDIIRKYSGAWSAARFIEIYDRSDVQILEQLRADPNRKVVFPSVADWKSRTLPSRRSSRSGPRKVHTIAIFSNSLRQK